MSFTTEQLKAIVESSFLKADHQFEYPPVCLKINGDFGKHTFATLGNFSTILAPPKVGKTTATGVIVSSLLSGEMISNFIPSLPEDKRVIVWADTEQGKPECIKTIQSICNQVNSNRTEHPDNLIFASLRAYSKDIRLLAIEYLVYNTPNLGFLVIDGIRDLVSSINDEREATLIADKLLKWTQEKNIHILNILHQNKGDANARGHLGTELMNKAETVASLRRDECNGKRITIIEPKYTRHKEFEDFAFTIDNNGIVLSSEVKTVYEPKSPKASELTFDDIVKILKGVFPDGESYGFTKLQQKLYEVCNEKLFESFGMNKCSDLIKRLHEEHYIIQKENSKLYVFNRFPL